MAIKWTNHTFSPWKGCTKVSAACDHCYAEQRMDKQYKMVKWGNNPRQPMADSTWKQPLAWNRKAAKAGVRRRVFCASIADVFDNHKSIKQEWRDRLWALIRATPHLDWMLLTKRPQNIKKYLPDDWGDGYLNVWLGVTVENQTEANRRIPLLLKIPATLHFLSCEPLLGEVDLTKVQYHKRKDFPDPVNCLTEQIGGYLFRDRRLANTIKWVIAGGESGSKARPSHPDWFRSLRDQCAAANVPFHFKQWGVFAPITDDELPQNFGPECDDFICMCSNGFVGDLSIGSAFLHNPKHYPNCFPNGQESDAVCNSVNMKCFGVKKTGRLLDGVLHDAVPKGGDT